MPRGTPFSLLLNCGYARTAVYQLFGKPPAASTMKKDKGGQQKEDNPGTSSTKNTNITEENSTHDSEQKGKVDVPKRSNGKRVHKRPCV